MAVASYKADKNSRWRF